MATSKVYDTVELLESILLELPIRDVLLAQRVAKSWQQTISGSIKLQRSLFFKPMAVLTASQSGPRDDIQFLALDTPCATVLQCPGPKTLLTSVLPVTKSSDSTTLHLDKSLEPNSDGHRPSWTRMLLTQPPRATEHFFSNCTHELCVLTDDSANFRKRTSMSHCAGATISHGSMFDLSAVKIEKHNGGGGVTLDGIAECLAELRQGWYTVSYRGRKSGDFGWVGLEELETVVKFWQEISSVMQERRQAGR
ncbi:hypothetical protein AC578_2763 [Pseudocercospora eumusae]|uniref:F-box domain-containing protein n=1 Tax=Pseudocercospora eumusae TaxID=321146 RepID=A0A139HGY6_9PEZI|nr:hypothetical protein AC578_2763 [Pseudocercospora eumusae]